VSPRRREDYEEPARLIIEAEEAVARVQGKLTGMFPDQGPDSRPRAPHSTRSWPSKPNSC